MRKFSFQQQVLAGFALSLLFVFASAITSYISITNVHSDEKSVDHSEESIRMTLRVQEYIVDAETSQRGYIITGSDSYLALYNRSINLIEPVIHELRQFIGENPGQVQRVDSLNFYASQKIAEMKRVVDLRTNKDFEAAKMQIETNRGKVLMEKARSIMKEIIASENKLLIERKAISLAGSNRTIWIVFVSSLIILGLIILLFSYIRRTFQTQKRIEDDMRSTNEQLGQISKENSEKNWLLTGSSSLDHIMRGEQGVNELAGNIITELAKYVNAQVAAIYIADDDKNILKLAGSYAFHFRKGNQNIIKLGEGMVGQAAFEKKPIVFGNIPADYIKISSGLGESSPQSILVQPFLFEDETRGVMELGFSGEISPLQLSFVNMVADSIGVAINSAQARIRLKELFEQIQQQAEELETQQEELRTTNEDLVLKTQQLQASEEELRVQQEELRQINAELEEKAELLEERNKAMDHAHEAISIKAEELELTSKYKSEFLANMSHELRTPLNSILILARILKDNKNANLSDEQIKYANVIHNAGTDLLTLINDILDLSKIESGKIELTIEEVSIKEIKKDVQLLFNEIAKSKQIDFTFNIAPDAPTKIVSDRMRVEQILKNLLSNSFKFTPDHGTIKVDVALANTNQPFFHAGIENQRLVSFTVKDSGIGISPEKQKLIFEAFQQEDGSTSRKYGGTGLGLSISRELANVLKGEIHVESHQGEGSTFTLFIPIDAEMDTFKDEEIIVKTTTVELKPPLIPFRPAKDENAPHTLLIIEDDVNFAEVLKDYATERGFTPLLAHQGDTGLAIAKEHLPDAIVLDIMLPVMDGWAVLKKLKENPATKDIPVHMMSAGDEKILKAKREGAIGFLKKPVEKEKLDEAFDKLISSGNFRLNRVLIIEDHEIQSENLRNQLAEQGVQVEQAFTAQQALDILNNSQGFDCIILDLNLPDMSGLDLLDSIKTQEKLTTIPVVINTAMELDKDTMARVLKHTHAMVLKNSKSNERLLDEVNLFMNKVKTTDQINTFGTAPLKKAKGMSTTEKVLKDKKVLIVDDDMRNIFALSSALQGYDVKIEIANNGKEALTKLANNPYTDLVLMDIMMPEMDGYEAMQEIRKQKRFAKLPIIALTAKAMKNDREKCIAAGANDYISKPVDLDKLLSLLRVWLS